MNYNEIKMNAPIDFDIVFDEKTQEWVTRPIKGFSEKHLNEVSFVPMKESHSANTYNSKNKNSNLHAAKREKNDEFYTMFEDIQNEMSHYKEFFKDKVVYCPCDKAFNIGRSEFFNYFASLFQDLGLKKLICTQYNPNGNGTIFEISNSIFGGKGIKWEYNGEFEESSFIDESEINTSLLKGNGSFDSDECYNIMNEADIIVTNPPFSLFRSFVNQLICLGKKFLIIGNQNAITYKEIFPLIMENKLWLGYYSPKKFRVTSLTNKNCEVLPNGDIIAKFGNICWFTNLPHHKRLTELYCGETYSEEKYPKYDNYDAIEVSKVCEIPKDYDGVMGVPITFLYSYCPSQFEIVDPRGFTDIERLKSKNTLLIKDKDSAINGKPTYARIAIRKK